MVCAKNLKCMTKSNIIYAFNLKAIEHCLNRNCAFTRMRLIFIFIIGTFGLDFSYGESSRNFGNQILNRPMIS